MKGFQTLLRWCAALAAAAGAAAVLWQLFERRTQRLDELDAYLLSEDDPESGMSLPGGDEEYLEQDFQEWPGIDPDQTVLVSFLVDPSQAETFQKRLADEGCSSNYDKQTRILETVLNGPKTPEEIGEFKDLLLDLLSTTQSTYLGFAFE